MTSLQKLKDYRDSNHVSQSELKAILSGKSYIKKPSLPILIGSYVDTVLTCAHLKDDLYYVVDVSRPTDKIVELCDSLYQWIDKSLLLHDPSPILENHLDEIEQWIDTTSYYQNRPNTRVEKFIKEAKEWWTVLVQKKDRQIITTMEELEAELINIRLVNDSNLDWIWKGEFQKDFYWEEEGVPCKGLGDICFDEVYIDIKYTTCPTLTEWWKVCANLNYPFQMSFYKSGLGFKKGYWLVINKDWHQLVEVGELMLQIGKWGYNIDKSIRIGKVEKDLNIHYPGYIDGLNLINRKGLFETNEQLYLSYLLN